MLGKLFGFGGRMGRMSYFGWVSLVFVFALFWVFAVLGGVAAGLVNGSGGALFGSVLLALLGVVPFVWVFSALATKRLRDAGFPPWIVVPAMMAFSVLDVLVLSPQTGGPALVALPYSSPVGFCANLIYGCVLLFWPSNGEPGEMDSGSRQRGAVPWHERALGVASRPPQERAPAAFSSRMPSSVPARTFGRRGA